MKLLLDTHVWVWAVSSPNKLGARVRRELQRTKNELFLSPVSIWEAKHMAQRKRYTAKPDFPRWLEKTLSEVPLREAPFTFAVAVTATQIELPQADPGDIFLAATALALDLTLVTADSQLLACTWLKTLANE